MTELNPQPLVLCLTDQHRRYLEEVAISYLISHPRDASKAKSVSFVCEDLGAIFEIVSELEEDQDRVCYSGIIAERFRDDLQIPLEDAKKKIDNLYFYNTGATSGAVFENALTELRKDDKRRRLKKEARSFQQGLQKINNTAISEKELDESMRDLLQDISLSQHRVLPHLSDKPDNDAFNGSFSGLWEKIVKNPPEFTKTHYPNIDELSGGGIDVGEYTVVAAKSGGGKSTFALNMAVRKAISEDVGVLCFSLEMKTSVLRDRIFSIVCGIPAQDIKNRSLSPEQIEAAAEKFDGCQELIHNNIKLYDKPGITPLGIKQAAHAFESDTGKKIGLIIIDYFGIMSCDNSSGRSEDKYREQEKAVMPIKGLSETFGCGVLVVSQLTDSAVSAYKCPDRIPEMQDYAESRALSHNAGQCWIIKESEGVPGASRLYCVKNRHGKPAWSVPLRFNGSTMEVTERANIM